MGDATVSLPNVVYILADDMGYGDLSCLNEESKLHTTAMDRVAAGGIAFTDAHSGSAVCTPTRYGVLTGRYCWRSELKRGVLWGFSRPLIPPERMTVASFLRGHGYHTACVGKWHVGLDWPLKDGGTATEDGDAWSVDYAAPIGNGPTTLGFDEFFGISASLDMPPYVYIEGDRCTGVPTVEKAFHRKGPAQEDFEGIDVLPRTTERAVRYIDERAKHPEQPFFLYFPLSAPHTPILPTEPFQGRSGTNAYGDFVLQVDDTVRQVLDALDRNGLAENTLVIVTSDNGCSPEADFEELATFGHDPSYVFRGHKADIFEGGHRIPFVARWPGRIAPGSVCDQTICLTDLLATVAEIVGERLPDDAGEDSVSILPALLGTATGPLREATVHHSIDGSFSIRQGEWKLELCPGSGGWSYPRPGSDDESDLPPVQLYNMAQDLGEESNLQADHPEIVARLTALMAQYIADGRSTPGTPQSNDGEPITLDP